MSDLEPVGVRPDHAPVGLLYSQIGYDAGDPVRVVVRGEGDAFDDQPCRVGDTTMPLRRWGDLWSSRWWTAEFDALPAGEHAVETGPLRGVLDVGEGRVFDATWRPMALDNFERRTLLPKDKPAWNDCGGNMQEAYSHTLAVLGLLDLYEHLGDRATDEERRRLLAQCRHGLGYLARLQDTARDLGLPHGSLCHDTLDFKHFVLIGNAAKAAACFARAAAALPFDNAAEREGMRGRAATAAEFVLAAEPHGAYGFVRHGHGLPPDWPVPGEHRTSDLLACLWAMVELAPTDPRMLPKAVALADRIMARQVPEGGAEAGISGHFYTFDPEHKLTERSWSHCIARGTFGSDGGQALPHYVLPILLLLRRHPDHERAAAWRESLRSFVFDFLLPATRLNPFGILPLGHVAGQGWIHFAGPWHGFNAIYGWTAALALELHREFDDRGLRDVAVANLQWICGLNAGLTREAMRAAVMATLADDALPPGEAVAYSMIQGVGRRSVGGWTNLRGNVSNGFAVGRQFEFDVPATMAEDGPFAYTDEDWIPHAAAFLAGACRL